MTHSTDRIYISAEHGSLLVVAGDPPPPWAAATPPSTPAKSDPKSVWVDHAIAAGIEVSSSMTKAEIIEAVDAAGEQ